MCMSRKKRRTSALRIPLSEALKDTPWFEVDGHKQLPPGKLPKFSGELQTPIVQSLSRLPAVDGVDRLDEVMSRILSLAIPKFATCLQLRAGSVCLV
jgi:hypothetical protein